MRISGTVCAPVPLLGLGRPFRRAKLPLERTVHAGSEVRPAGPSSGLIAQIKGGPLPTKFRACAILGASIFLALSLKRKWRPTVNLDFNLQAIYSS